MNKKYDQSTEEQEFEEMEERMEMQKQDVMGYYEDRTLAYTAMKVRTIQAELEKE